MKIAIIGTRGIPNFYGGFEQFAEYLAKGLAPQGVDVTVYNSHRHPFQGKKWNGVHIVHCYDPEHKLGTIGQFIYDFNCIKDVRKRGFDIVLQLGYTSSSVWGWLLPRKNTVISTNMDGLEWKRTKYSKVVRWFLKRAEYLATIYSDYWISDSIGIQEYLKNKYDLKSTYIPYGADCFNNPDSSILKKYEVVPYEYHMLIARLEPENNINVILEGVKITDSKRPFLVIGNHNTQYGNFLKEKYSDVKCIRFCGGIYDIVDLNNLRYFTRLYFHGHSVGGTNPSLLEAMGSQSLICAHKNIFNYSILGDDALYFETADDVKFCIESVYKSLMESKVKNNYQKVQMLYSWDKIVESYKKHFEQIGKKNKNV